MQQSGDWITVRAPARLHLGFVDPGNTSGRRFGSLGMAVSGLDAVVDARACDTLQTTGPHADKLSVIAQRILETTRARTAVALRVRSAPPSHAGLGSGTLLALTAGTACARALGVELSARELAALAGRGQRSGIGIASFEQGGFLIDGGRGPVTALPPLLARVAFPEDWRVVLVFDERREGLSGVAERAAFGALPAMAPAIADELSRRVLLGVLPALHEADFASFSEHLAAVQRLNGRYFAPAQGGFYSSAPVGNCLSALAQEFALPGIGQSSWGPTGFIVTPDVATAERVVAAFEQRAAEGLRCQIVAGANSGALHTTDVPSGDAAPVGQPTPT